MKQSLKTFFGMNYLGLKNPFKKKKWTQVHNPAVKNSGGGWEVYLLPLSFDENHCSHFPSIKKTPEAVLISFFSSLMKKNSDFKKALVPGKATPILDYRLERLKAWNIHHFQLIERKKIEKDMYWIRVALEGEWQGAPKILHGETWMKRVGKKWYVTLPQV